MCSKLSILSFIGAFLAGVSGAALPSALPTVFTITSTFGSQVGGFTKEEAEAKIGRRVRVAGCSSLNLIGKRRDDPEGMWLDLTVGERGTVGRMEEVAPGRYWLIVYWDDPKAAYPYRSHYRKAGQYSVYGECLSEELLPCPWCSVRRA